ncbi:MAG: TolB family protein [bacterium]
MIVPRIRARQVTSQTDCSNRTPRARAAALGALVVALSALASACAISNSSSSSTAGIGVGAAPGAGSSAAVTARIIDGTDPLHRAGERHLGKIRQLTFGGENAEGYFSFDGTRLVLQSTRDSFACDQIFIMDLASGESRLASELRGKNTCAYFLGGDREILFASTQHDGRDCPPRPDYSRGYVWPLDNYDIFALPASPGGESAPPRRLTDNPGYDAEATVSPDGKRIIWTSLRDGDLDLYSMNADGTDVRRLTSTLGYDGGAFYAPDSKRIVYRAHHPATPEAITHYKGLIAANLVEPKALEIMVADADGGNARAITHHGAASFAPFWHPDGKRILFASNLDDPNGRDFDIFMINDDGTGLEKVVADSTFDGFPVFSPDGKHLVFASNRASKARGETNLFIAEWID